MRVVTRKHPENTNLCRTEKDSLRYVAFTRGERLSSFRNVNDITKMRKNNHKIRFQISSRNLLQFPNFLENFRNFRNFASYGSTCISVLFIILYSPFAPAVFMLLRFFVFDATTCWLILPTVNQQSNAKIQRPRWR